MTNTPDPAAVAERLLSIEAGLVDLLSMPDNSHESHQQEILKDADTCRQAAAVIEAQQGEIDDLRKRVGDHSRKCTCDRCMEDVSIKAALANPTAGGGEGEA